MAVPAWARPQLSARAEGGVAGYTGTLGDAVQPGGSWGLRVEARAAPTLSFGVAYDGSANQLAGYGGGAPPLLNRHAGSAYARLEPEGWLVAPFAEAGVGASRLSIGRGSGGSDFATDYALELPVGAGVRLQSAGLSAGVRLTYRRLVGNGVYARGGGDLLGASLTLGARF